MQLRRFNITVRVFDPERPEEGEDFILPVDSPDAEHAVSATMSNAITFTTKLEGDQPQSLAFRCIRVERRED